MTKQKIIKKWEQARKDEKYNARIHGRQGEPQAAHESKMRMELIKEFLKDLQ